MKLIFLSESGRESFAFKTSEWTARLFILAVTAFLMAAGAFAMYFLMQQHTNTELESYRSQWQTHAVAEKHELQLARQQIEHELEALTLKVATLQARIMRLDALGVRVAQVAKLDKGEFDFSKPPAVGGPELAVNSTEDHQVLEASIVEGQIYQLMNKLESLVDDRERQLSLLDRQLMAQEFRSEAYVTGRPVTWGWMSSAYGFRIDPFSKQRAWHNGVDFAGKEGGEVVAVAGGVVTASGKRYGYGNLVEINHGNGLVTRYAHNKSHLVAVGDVVEKGQVIAKMGSTGRSTGPHVHFEVLRHGKPINPERYIYRASL